MHTLNVLSALTIAIAAAATVPALAGQLPSRLPADLQSESQTLFSPGPDLPKRTYLPSFGRHPVELVADTSEVDKIRAAAASGRLSLLPGVNLSGLEFNAATRPGLVNHNYVQPTNGELDYYAAKGIKVVRLPFLWERLAPSLRAKTPNTVADAAYLQLIVNVLIHAHADGMGVIVDMHNYGAYDGIKIGSTGGVSIGDFAASWKAIALQLRSYPALLGYDLMNEPNKMPSSTVWPAAAQAAVTAIRQVDTRTAIFVEGDSYASAGSWPAINGKLNISDPQSLLVYEAHVYGDRDNSGTHYSWNTEAAAGVTVNTIAQRVAVFDSWCKTNHRLCIIGEVGVGIDNGNWNVQLDNGLTQMKRDGLLAAFYWAGGPWWGSYPLSIEPIKGVDRPQMDVLSKYAQ